MSRSLQVTCVLTLLFFNAKGQCGDKSAKLGIYHWGGERTTSMSEGIERIAQLGGSVARVAYSPRYYSDYGIGKECYPDFSLTALAQEPDVRRSLDNSNIRVLILTTYDGTTFGDCLYHHYLNPLFYTSENIGKLQAEYSDFVFHLYSRYAYSGRRFIISNWEGDNAIYCGAAYSYMVVEDFRQSCDTNYPLWYDGNAGPEQSVQGMSLWLRTRQEGIANGIARARAMGLTGLEVLHGPEISSVRFLEEGGLRSMLRDVLPNVRPDYVLYSSYESLNGKDPTQALKKDIERIRAISGVSDIIIGEAGYSRSLWRQDGVTRMEAAMFAAFESGVAYFICWNLNDQGVDSDFGVFDTSGALTPAGRLVARVLGGQME